MLGFARRCEMEKRVGNIWKPLHNRTTTASRVRENSSYAKKKAQQKIKFRENFRA